MEKLSMESQTLYAEFMERDLWKMFNFGQDQGRRRFQPQEYIEYFED